eukprot:1005093-Amphidinium_carterae.1
MIPPTYRILKARHKLLVPILYCQRCSKKEIDTLISSKTISTISLQERDALKLKCKKIGWQYSELPCKGVFKTGGSTLTAGELSEPDKALGRRL